MNTCNVVSISLFEKEKLMNNVESLIKIKRKNLIEKKKEINKKKKINEYLHYVELDYQTYLQHFKNQKQKQIDSFNLINNYLFTYLPHLLCNFHHLWFFITKPRKLTVVN